MLATMPIPVIRLSVFWRNNDNHRRRIGHLCVFLMCLKHKERCYTQQHIPCVCVCVDV